jgi:hypothetical protein
VRQHPIRLITEKETALFERDGAVLLRGLFDLAWIERLHGAIERLRNRSGPLSEVYCAEGGDGGFYKPGDPLDKSELFPLVWERG